MIGNFVGTTQESIPPTPFVPTSVSGCILWLDGNDPAGTGTQPSNGSSVASWVDKSSQVNTATQATGPLQPTFFTSVKNGKGGVYFDNASSQVMTLPTTGFPTGSGAMSMFLVFEVDSVAPSSQFLIGYGGGPNQNIYWASQADGWNNFSSGAGGFINADASSLTGGTFYRSSMQAASGVTTDMFTYTLNGASRSQSSSNVTTLDLVTGGGSLGLFLTGYLCEIIFYNSQISGGNFSQVQNYLSGKWGI